MDFYRNFPLGKRTRSQYQRFCRQVWEEKKAAENRSRGGSERREKVREAAVGTARVEGSANLGSGRVIDSESVAIDGVGDEFGDVVVIGENLGDREGVGSVDNYRAQSSRVKKGLNSKKGLKENRNVGRIDVNFKKKWKSEKGVVKNQNVVLNDVDLKKISKSIKGVVTNENVGPTGVDLIRKGLTRNRNVGPINVDFVGNLKSDKGLGKKKNIVSIDDDDDDESEEVVFLHEVVSSNSSAPVSRLNLGLDRYKDCANMDVEEVVSCSRKMGESTGVKINGGKGFKVSSQARSQVRSEDVYVDLEDSEDPSESSSEEDNDDSDDEDFGVDNSCSSFRSDETSSCCDDDDDDDDEEEEEEEEEYSVLKRGSDTRKRKGNVGEVGLERNVKPSCVVSLEKSSSYSVEDEVGDGNGSSIMMEENVDGEGKELRKRKFRGFDILVDCGKENIIKETKEPKTMAERLRPRFISKSQKKKLEFGSYSRPVPVDEDEEPDSSSGHDEENESENHGNDNPENIQVPKDKVEFERKLGRNPENIQVPKDKVEFARKLGRNPENIQVPKDKVEFARKLGRNPENIQVPKDKVEFARNLGRNPENIQVPKDKVDFERKLGRKAKGKLGNPDILKILANSMWENGDAILDDIVSSGENGPNQETIPQFELQLKFSFEDEDSPPLEKSESEKEVDRLFEELDFALTCCEIGSDNSSQVDNDVTISTETETDPATLCRQGHHCFVLDEQIGLLCKFCSFVELEIKHILPSFCKHHWGKQYNKETGKSGHNLFNELEFQNSGYEYPSGFDHSVQAKGTVWDIIPGVRNSMYPHQREGFEFIWKNIAGGINLEKLKKTSFESGSGCIISHAPGTGKTRLTIVFLQTYLELFPACRPVIIAPRNMLLTWEEEFRKWKVDIPFHNMNKKQCSGHENKVAMSILRRVRDSERSINTLRMVKLYSWRKDRSILGISYRLLETLAGGGDVDGGGKKEKINSETYEVDLQVRKILRELPSLLVLDEGHTPRNSQSLIWKVLSKIETNKRIILSGTPFQNNFSELYNTLCLVRPKFDDRISSGNYGDFRRRRGRKVSLARGKWDSLTSCIGKNSDDKSKELRAMIDPFVHVHKGTILQECLPGLRDCLVLLKPTPLQKTLFQGIEGMTNPLKLGYLVSLISVHPSLLLQPSLSESVEPFIDRNELEKTKFNPGSGVKTKFLLELIRLSDALNEKVLVFSQYIDPLTFIRDQLKSHFKWTEGKEVLYMDGKLDEKPRQCSISNFNDPTSEVKVLLASTRACSEGINLVGASRVVLLDVVWNPSVERQAISRAYRIGQKKIVYIYHLIACGTMEGEKYARQAEKDRLSELVFSSTERNFHQREISSTVSEDKILEEMVQHDKLKYMFEKILNQPKESDLIETFGLPTVSEDEILEEMVQHDKLKYMFEKILNQPKESDLIETFGLVDP